MPTHHIVFLYNFVQFNVIQLLAMILFINYYSKIRPFSEFLQSFLTGIFCGIIIMLISPLVLPFFDFENITVSIFLHAAFLEKFISFILLFSLIKTFQRENDIIKILTAGIQLGAGFAFLENLIYLLNFEKNITVLRIISSVPMHLSTIGIQSYFLGLAVIHSLKKFKIIYYFLSVFLPVLIHSLYDNFVIVQNSKIFLYLTGIIIVVSVFMFEFLFSKAQSFPKKEDLIKENLRFEDWLTLELQKAHSKWILYSSGNKSIPQIPFFRIKINYFKFTIAFLLILYILIFKFYLEYLPFFETIPYFYKYSLFVVMPASFSVLFIIIGIVNPEYFKNKKLRIPIILDVDILLPNRRVTTSLCYDLRPYSSFLHSEEEFIENETVLIIFRYTKETSYPVQGKILKYISNKNKEFQSGIIVKINIDRNFYFFYLRYMIFRILKGFIFLFKLQDRKKILSLFVRPITLMQNEVEYKKGTIIFHQEFKLIKKGKVEIYKEISPEERIKISELQEGDIFGEMALFSNQPRSATAICSEDTILAIAHKDYLDTIIQANPDFAIALILNLVKIIQKREKELENLIKDYKI